jgi:hypothetical protein
MARHCAHAYIVPRTRGFRDNAFRHNKDDMRCVTAILFCAGATLFWEPAARAQQVVSLDKLPAAASGFDDSQAHEALACKVHPVKPALNFGFRFQTGYTFETSLDPYLDGQHHWYVVFRVTPEDNAGPSVYFLDSIDLPEPRQSGVSGVTGEDSGAFQTGEGRYNVRWSLLDDLGRVCRQEWTVDAHPTTDERSEKIAMPPGTVGDFSWRPPATANTVTKSRHVTILLNAAMPKVPVMKNGLPVDRWGMLLSMLASVVEQMPEASLRVVAFDTQQQRELFRKDDFTAKDMNDVEHVSDARERMAVDYQVLQNPAGGWDLLRDLENKEINAPSPADTVIFLGVPEGRFDKMPPGMPGPKTAPRFLYLKYGPTQAIPRYGPLGAAESGRGPTDAGYRKMGGATGPRSLAPPGASAADQPDLVEQSVKHLNGKIFVVSSPADFSKALATIGR